MSQFERAIAFEADSDEVYAHLAEPQHYHSFTPTVMKLEPLGEGRVRVHGDLHGRSFDTEGYARVDASQRRIEWGSEGDHRYSGSLEVKPGDTTPFVSEITMTLSFSAEAHPDQQGEHILLSMERSLEAIRLHFESADH